MTALTDVLAAHRPYGLDCKCGVAINSDEGWARHAEEMVAAAGLVVTRAPAPKPRITRRATAWGLAWKCEDCGATGSGAPSATFSDSYEHHCEIQQPQPTVDYSGCSGAVYGGGDDE